jgi:hypothetical protein
LEKEKLTEPNLAKLEKKLEELCGIRPGTEKKQITPQTSSSMRTKNADDYR